MLAFIPYYPTPMVELPFPGDEPMVLDSWAVLVAVAFVVGMEMARARGLKLGLDVRDIVDGSVFIVAMGFLVGHLVHVLAYHPEIYERDGVMSLVRFWEGFSSMGGFLGAVLGSVLFFVGLRKRPYWLHADTIAWGLPFGWVFGRLGCFTAHDHIGRATDFFLAVNFPTMGPRHDLGLYEALWSAGIASVFWALRRRATRPGFYLALFAMLYAPARFGLDFLRSVDLESSDLRYSGLTPAQWLCVVMFVGGALVVLRLRAQAPTAAAPAQPPDR